MLNCYKFKCKIIMFLTVIFFADLVENFDEASKAEVK